MDPQTHFSLDIAGAWLDGTYNLAEGFQVHTKDEHDWLTVTCQRRWPTGIGVMGG